jgi:glycosidase
MGYNWEGHHIMNEMAQGKKTVAAWDEYMTKIDTLYQKDDFLMNFITNHDENSWNGTVKERMGDAGEAMLALSYTLPGMPLIYSGQEYDMDHRLLFFEKDSIPKTKAKVWPVMVKLGELKNTNSALAGGKEAAAYTRLKTTKDDQVLAFSRGNGDDMLIYVANLTKAPVKFKIELDGKFQDYMSSGEVDLEKDMELEFKPWEYKILINN